MIEIYFKYCELCIEYYQLKSKRQVFLFFFSSRTITDTLKRFRKVWAFCKIYGIQFIQTNVGWLKKTKKKIDISVHIRDSNNSLIHQATLIKFIQINKRHLVKYLTLLEFPYLR